MEKPPDKTPAGSRTVLVISYGQYKCEMTIGTAPAIKKDFMFN
jgi:hypothetical protein